MKEKYRVQRGREYREPAKWEEIGHILNDYNQDRQTTFSVRKECQVT